MAAVWPSAEWSTWPMTRSAALAFNGIVLVLCILSWVGLHLWWKKRDFNSKTVVYRRCFYRWGFWPCGQDYIEQVADDMFEIMRDRCYCGGVCVNGRHLFNKASVISVERSRQTFWWGIPWAVGCGLLLGLWLHFVPCIWWTCDWGDHDGQGVRGGIWFATWAAAAAVMLWLHCSVCADVTYWRDGQGGQARRVAVAKVTVGRRGGCWTTQACELDIEQLKLILLPHGKDSGDNWTSP